MTEDQIERRVERVMDALDARLMDGRLSQADYDWEVKNLETWASQQYRASGYVSVPMIGNSAGPLW